MTKQSRYKKVSTFVNYVLIFKLTSRFNVIRFDRQTLLAITDSVFIMWVKCVRQQWKDRLWSVLFDREEEWKIYCRVVRIIGKTTIVRSTCSALKVTFVVDPVKFRYSTYLCLSSSWNTLMGVLLSSFERVMDQKDKLTD